MSRAAALAGNKNALAGGLSNRWHGQRAGEKKRLADRDEARKFEQSLLGWLDDAYNLARWLLRDDQDAQDAVQDAFMRAVRFASGFRGGDRRAWLLAIVRNVCYTQLSRSRTAASNVVFDEEQHQGAEPGYRSRNGGAYAGSIARR